jgi:hypothetical protein
VNLTFPTLKWPIEKDSFDALQKWIFQMRDLFANHISYGTNMDSQVLEFEFVAGSTPTKAGAGAVAPIGVLLLRIEQIEPASNTPPAIASGFSWTYANGSLSFPSFGTIAGTSRYRARVLVMRS